MKMFILVAALVAFSAPALANEPAGDAAAAEGKMAKGKKGKKSKKGKKDAAAPADKPADKPADAPK
jgi:hypothetical protein